MPTRSQSCAGSCGARDLITFFGKLPTTDDSIVLASPGKPSADLADAMSELGIEYRTIGDAYAPRDVEAAFLEGFEVGFAVQ